MHNSNGTTCLCCPRHCAVDRAAATGYCGAGPIPRVARASLHHWEEPMLSGSRGSGAVFFSGCNLKCIFCQNKEISAQEKGSLCNAQELARIFLYLQQRQAHNINLVTPTPHLHILYEALLTAKAHGLCIPVVYNCGGYESAGALKKLNGLIDIYLPDLKYVTPARSGAYSGASDYFTHAASALEEMHRQAGQLTLGADGIAKRGLLIRHLVLPGNLDETRCALQFIANTFPKSTYISLMRQYTPASPALPTPLSRRLTKREYERAVAFCISHGFTNVLIQESKSSDIAFIPEFYDELPIVY